MAAFIFFFLFYYQKRHNQFLDTVAGIKKQYEAELLQTQLDIQEHTLTHISQEVHDNIGQLLTVVKVQLGAIATEDESVIQQINESLGTLSKAIHDLRHLTRNLNSEYIQQKGILHCVTEELELVNKTGILQANIKSSGNWDNFPASLHLILFRIFQELLNNSLKHAQCKKLEVILSHQENKVLLKVTDDGVGFELSKVASQNSLGLYNLKLRIQQIGGEINIQSTPSNGCSTTVFIPLHP